ncbi:MAG: Ig-like domain-containing protein [Clostridia bacterium]|nr:Ig-like domain-containing protein [Clostridia bacterium]
MSKNRGKTAARAISVLLVIMMLFAVCGNVLISASAAGSYGKTIYLKTTTTKTPYIHYWCDGNKEYSSAWPGVAMQAIDNDVYYLDLPCDVGELTGIIILKDGGGDGSKLTDDVTNITGNLYDLEAKSWSMYDTSAIKIKSFSGDLESPAYVNANITLSVEAEGGDGNLQYKFSVSGTAKEVIQDFSTKNTAVWTPTAEGTYTLTAEVKDGAGETNSREITYEIKDPAKVEQPVFLGASPANNAQIKKGGSTTVIVDGAGGNVNNKILFYKTEVIDPDGSPVNTVYYQTGNRLSFTPDKLGTYTVNMSIQNNTVKNDTVTVTYTYTSVNDLIESDTDENVAVTGVTLDQKTASLKVGDTVKLNATVNPSDATDKSVTWSSSKESVATVASDGTVTAAAEGEATITVTTKDGGFKAECVVTVTGDDTEVATDTSSDDTDTTTDTTTDTATDVTSDTETDSEQTTDTTSDADTDSETVVTDLLGDVDGNGKVELKDAYLIQSMAIGKKVPTDAEFKKADVNHDNKVSLKDASMVQQCSVGLIKLS